MIPQELRAQPGDNIAEKFNALAEYISTLPLRAGDESIHVSRTPHGAIVTRTDYPPSIQIPLTVRVATPYSFVVSEGYINGLIPRGKNFGGKLEDCFDPLSGQVLARISMPREPEPIYFFVCVRFTRLLVFLGGQMEVRAFHRDEVAERLGGLGNVFAGRTYPSTADAKGDGDLEAYIPLAMMRNNQDVKKTRLIQFVRHNLLCRIYQPAGFTGVRKFVFWAT